MSKGLSFVASIYFGTGEGATVAMLITRAYPMPEDYKVQPSFDNGEYIPGELVRTQDERALREFADTFGSWMAHGADVYTEEQFLERFDSYLPANVKTMIQNFHEPGKTPGNFNWQSEYHVNYS